MFEKKLSFTKDTCSLKTKFGVTEPYSKLLILDALQGSEYTPLPSIVES